MDAGVDPFDLSAAYLRKARGDARAFMEGLAVRLEGALPDAITIRRKRDGLFSGAGHVTAIHLSTETSILNLTLDHGVLHASRSKVIRGVAIGSADMSVPAWLEEVAQSVGSAGADAEAARAALHDFLLS